MTTPESFSVYGVERFPHSIPISEMVADQRAIFEDYQRSHQRKNHGAAYTDAELKEITRFLETRSVKDETQPTGERQMFIFDLMKPLSGRAIIKEYADKLLTAEMKTGTRRKKISCIRRLCNYIIQHPVIPGPVVQSICAKYGTIEQPVLSYDYPTHVVDDPPQGRVLTEDQLYQLYKFVLDYAEHNSDNNEIGRDAAMIVLDAEGNLRCNELRMLDASGPNRALLYEECKIYIAYGKGFRGSGPIPRVTVFTPLAQSVMRVYEEKVRSRFPDADKSCALFLTSTGDRVSGRMLRKRLKIMLDLARNAGVNLPLHVTWHSLRRTFATLYMERKSDHTFALASLLGHRTLSTLRHYVLHNQDYVNGVIKQLYEDLMPSKNK
jgi:site-specific recombinase XerD